MPREASTQTTNDADRPPEPIGPIGAPDIEQLPKHQQLFIAAREERRRRARPMSPEERRGAIIDATLPLIKKHGFDITTRQIAAAAHVAEGTIFRVFHDKDELLRQAIEVALDPSESERQLLAIDPTAPLAERVLEATEILRDRLKSVTDLMVVVRMSRPPEDPRRPAARHEGLMHALTKVFEPDRKNLQVEPAQAARLLRLMSFSAFHPVITDHNPLEPKDLVDVLLNGVRKHDDWDPSP